MLSIYDFSKLICDVKLVVAIAKCQRAKQKLEDDRTELCYLKEK